MTFPAPPPPAPWLQGLFSYLSSSSNGSLPMSWESVSYLLLRKMNFTSPLLPEVVDLECSHSLPQRLNAFASWRKGSKQGFEPVPLSHPLPSSLLCQRGDTRHSPALTLPSVFLASTRGRLMKKSLQARTSSPCVRTPQLFQTDMPTFPWPLRIC